MALLDKLNPLKKKDDFPEFKDSLGATSSGSVPGPSFEDSSTGNNDFSQLPSASPSLPSPAAPPQTDQKLNGIQSSINLVLSKLDGLKSGIDALNQRVTALETKVGSSTTASATPSPITYSAPTPQPTQSYSQPEQTSSPQQQNKPANEEEEGWHF